MSIAKNFTENIRSSSPSGFSTRMENVFNQTFSWMRTEPHMYGFDSLNGNPDLEDSSPYGIARQYFHFFQTHFMKVYYSLLDLSDELINRGEYSWFDNPYLHVLDIGAGSGAATMALIDLLCSYREYCWQNGYAAHATHINLVAIEPATSAVTLLRKMGELMQSELDKAQIELQVTHVKGEFPHPDCIEQIKNQWHPSNPNTFLVLSSNVIKWMQQSHDRDRRLLKFLGIASDVPELGEIEAIALKNLIEHYKPRYVSLLDIATRNQVNKKSLFQVLKDKISGFLQIFVKSNDLVWWSKDEEKTIQFLNTQQSFFWQQGQRKPARTNYLLGIRLTTQSIGEECKRWDTTIDPQNIELAWVRARYHILRDDLVDEIEVRLTDYLGQSYLERLRKHLLFGQTEIVELNHRLNYWGAKKINESRPRYMLRMGEQIISAAFSQSNPDAFDPVNSQHVFGNRLNRKPNEFFYEPWIKHHKAYVKTIIDHSGSDEVICKLDIESYYTNIRQDLLYKELCIAIQISENSPLKAVIRQVTLRNLATPPHRLGYGLPQSGVTAGLWSDYYLYPIDKEMLGQTPLIKFVRYADDMTIVAPAHEIEDAVTRIRNRLGDPLDNSGNSRALGIKLNETKTSQETIQDYRQRNTSDPRFDILGKRSRQVINPLYHLPHAYRQFLKTNRNDFIREYQSLLSNVQIYLPDFPFWLNRKIFQGSLTRNRIGFYVQRVRGLTVSIQFPEYELGLSDQQKEEWVQQFFTLNPSWLTARRLLVAELTGFFKEGYEHHKNATKHLHNQARKVMRFSAYRIMWFGVNTISAEIHEIMRHTPWDLSAKLMLKALVDCGKEKDVLDLARQWHTRTLPIGASGECLDCASSLCASACRALGFSESTQETQEFLWTVLLSNRSHLVEQLNASEALIRLKANPIMKMDELREFIQQNMNSPYLLKNLILLISCLDDNSWHDLAHQIARTNNEMIVQDALQFALLNPCGIFDVAEPAIVEKYYSTEYPDVPIRGSSTSSIF